MVKKAELRKRSVWVNNCGRIYDELGKNNKNKESIIKRQIVSRGDAEWL